jgi:hypothetical protein
MKKLLFGSLLTIAIVFARATGGSDDKPGTSGTKKIDTTSRKGAGTTSGTVTPKKGGKKSTSGSFDIPSYSWGASQAGVKTGGNGNACGKVGLGDIKVGNKNGANKAGKQPPAKRPVSAPPAK